MKLRKVSARDAVMPKASIHKSGRLGFSANAIVKLGLSVGRGVNVYESDKTIYLQIVDLPDADAFQLKLGGEYYFATTEGLFELLGLPFRTEELRYMLRRTNIDGLALYEMLPYKSKRKR